MEYKVGDYLMFKMSEIPTEIKFVIETLDEYKLYQVLDIDNGLYYIDVGYMTTWFDSKLFLTKLELRSSKIKKILNGIQSR